MPESQTFKPSSLGPLPMVIFLGFIFLFLGVPTLILTPLTGLLITIGIAIIIFLIYLSVKLTTYELHDDGLFIRKGIIAKKQILLLYTQIQDVTEYLDLWGRIAGLKSLQIKTMTSTSAFAGSLRNLAESDADRLKQLLLQQVNNRSKRTNQKNASINTSQNKSSQYDMDKEQDEKSSNPYPVHFDKLGIISAIFWIVILIIIGEVAYLFDSSIDWSANSVIWILIIVSAPIRYFIQQATFKYWISENTITIKSGLIATQKTSIEYEKVQDFILSQSIFERIVGLATIRIETGSVVIPTGDNNKQVPNYEILALKLNDARALSDKIMKKTGINYTLVNKPLVQEIPLNQKKILKKTLSGFIGLFILFGIILAIFWVTTLTNENTSRIFTQVITWAIIIFAILTILTLIYQKIYYDRYFYDMSKNTLTIRKGVIGRQQIFLPFEKVQNVFMDQDLLDRIFGLYDVHLSTVGQGSIRLCHIDGLTKENASRMLTVILKQVKANS